MPYLIAFVGGFVVCVGLGLLYGRDKSTGLPGIPIIVGICTGNITEANVAQCMGASLLGWVLYLGVLTIQARVIAAKKKKKSKPHTDNALDRPRSAKITRIVALADLYDSKGNVVMVQDTIVFAIGETPTHYIVCSPHSEISKTEPNIYVSRM